MVKVHIDKEIPKPTTTLARELKWGFHLASTVPNGIEFLFLKVDGDHVTVLHKNGPYDIAPTTVLYNPKEVDVDVYVRRKG
jgi:hypothetical protein